MPQLPYQTKLLERIAYQTSGTSLEFDDYLRKVVGKPRFERMGKPKKAKVEEPAKAAIGFRNAQD